MLVILAQQGQQNDPDVNKLVKGASKAIVKQKDDMDDQEDGIIQACNLAARIGHTHKETGEEKGDEVWVGMQLQNDSQNDLTPRMIQVSHHQSSPA